MDVCISTTAKSDQEGHKLLALMGMPIREGATALPKLEPTTKQTIGSRSRLIKDGIVDVNRLFYLHDIASHPFETPQQCFTSRRCIDQLCLRTTVSGRGCIRSSSYFPIIMDEKAVARQIIDEIRIEASRMKQSIGVIPGLAVILVGDRKISESYEVPCGFVGIKTFVIRLAEDSSEEEEVKSVSRFNDDEDPFHLDEQKIVNTVSVHKDVDGCHPLNIGQLAMRGREPLFVPRTPKGCIELLHRYNFEIKGKRAVVIGRSDIFGMPAALLLRERMQLLPLFIIHSKTKNPEELIRQADIILSAAGQPNLVRGSWIKPGAIVINVGFSLVKVSEQFS
ncbi:Tetrahydrofolate dehydrogenase/cyclohydrolase catalytic domain [Arabidopsis suecica]|uniref:methylenetetrahydrofolate dehydrogenase (NADP(+)) n=1 Tax=Arabidopsis suecica TaxID=45249 RepID=A0A8T1ZDH5_ARASU|nr:Tetrahydrofolate dehydrogenase/cyclohydrolase catalytic domain [Arabidopsis suecica]